MHIRRTQGECTLKQAWHAGVWRREWQRIRSATRFAGGLHAATACTLLWLPAPAPAPASDPATATARRRCIDAARRGAVNSMMVSLVEPASTSMTALFCSFESSVGWSGMPNQPPLSLICRTSRTSVHDCHHVPRNLN